MARSKLKSVDTMVISDATKKNAAISVAPERRDQMIAEAAYFRAEKRGFSGGHMMHDWLEAEAEVDRMLQQ